MFREVLYYFFSCYMFVYWSTPFYSVMLVSFIDTLQGRVHTESGSVPDSSEPYASGRLRVGFAYTLLTTDLMRTVYVRFAVYTLRPVVTKLQVLNYWHISRFSGSWTRVDVPWSCGMESKMQHAGDPRDVTTESVSIYSTWHLAVRYDDDPGRKSG